MSVADRQAIFDAAVAFVHELKRAADSSAFAEPVNDRDDGEPDGASAFEDMSYIVEKEAGALKRAGADRRASLLALVAIVPPRTVLEDHRFLFARFPAVAAAHAKLQESVSAEIARLLNQDDR